MNILQDIVGNEAIIIALVAWFVAQTIKVIILSIREKSFSFSWYVIPGGFPSAHSAAVVSFSTAMGMEYGFDSGLFAVSVGLAAFILYDALVLRRASQRQAKSLNEIIEAIKLREEDKPLREVLGHSWYEVLAGCFLGFFIAYFMML